MNIKDRKWIVVSYNTWLIAQKSKLKYNCTMDEYILMCIKQFEKENSTNSRKMINKEGTK